MGLILNYGCSLPGLTCFIEAPTDQEIVLDAEAMEGSEREARSEAGATIQASLFTTNNAYSVNISDSLSSKMAEACLLWPICSGSILFSPEFFCLRFWTSHLSFQSQKSPFCWCAFILLCKRRGKSMESVFFSWKHCWKKMSQCGKMRKMSEKKRAKEMSVAKDNRSDLDVIEPVCLKVMLIMKLYEQSHQCFNRIR